jgi:hypothetical protein
MLKNFTTKDEPTGISLELYHADDGSAIFLKDADGIIGRKYYTRRIHKHDSEGDYKNLKTELLTYGYRHGLLPLWEHILTTKR